MKKITFKQKLYNFWHNEKFIKVRDITLFVSLGINLLIFILFGVVSCSIKESENSNDQITQSQTQLVHNRKNRVLTNYNDGDIFKVSFPSQIYLAPSQLGYFSAQYGLINIDHTIDSEYNEKHYVGNVIYSEQVTENNTTYLRLNFYDSANQRQFRFSLRKQGDWYYKDNDNDYTLYFCYYKDSPNNVAFFDWLNNNEELSTCQTLFSFNDFWRISDYVNSQNGLSNGQYVIGSTSSNYLLSTGFYINGTYYNGMGYTFDEVDTYESWTMMPNGSGGIVTSHQDFQAYYYGNNFISTFNENTEYPSEYKYIFKELVVFRQGDSSSQLTIATTKRQNAKGTLMGESTVADNFASTYKYDINAEIADTMQWLNDSYKNIRFTGQNYVDYIESVVFPYEVEDGYIKGTNMPNYNAVSYLNYSYSMNHDGYEEAVFDEDSGVNPLTLLAQAFTGLTSLLSIGILPGITIGLLLCLPLVVGIIVLVFKAVKK